MSTTTVRIAAHDEAERCARALTLAFAADEVCRWVWPDPAVYLEAFPRFVRAFGGGAFDAGTAHTVGGCLGAALWLPPGLAPDDDAVEAVLRETVDARSLGVMFSLFERMAAHHPSEPHWHLPLIGVDPRGQGRGVGSALLAHALGVCDRAGITAYLEATSVRNVALYERHGFEALGEIRVGGAPPVIPMARVARTVSAASSNGGAAPGLER